MKTLAKITIASLAVTAASACESHQVQEGDTCWKISNDNGISLDEFYGLNNGINCDSLQVGQSVCVANDGKTYTVQGGDTCWKIANDNGISLDQLTAANPGVVCENLEVGQVLNLGGKSKANAKTLNKAKNNKGGNKKGESKGHEGKGKKEKESEGKGEESGPAPSGDKLVSYEQFARALQACGAKASQDKYNAFIGSARSAGGITSKRELAMFLAQILHESGGLEFRSEIDCQKNSCADRYRTPGDPGNKFYFGRGYIQLTWSPNYKAASKELYGDDRLLQNPNQVATNEKIAWDTAFWFWKKNCHNDPGVKRGQFGSSTMKINGGIECPGCKKSCPHRFENYKKVLKAFGVNEAANNAGC